MKTYDEMAKSVLRRIGEQKAKQRRRRKITAAAVSCLCLAVLVFAAARHAAAPPNRTDPQEASAASADGQKPDASGNDTFTEPPVMEEKPIYDMIGLVVYKGRTYTQAGIYGAEDAGGLVGDYLGHADGNIDEWSSKADYEKEFASNMRGDVYTVKGYDEDFRICVAEGDCIVFMENLKGRELSIGKDLFGDGLRIEGRISSARYKLHHDWNNGISSLKELAADDALDKFINELYDGGFEYMYESNPRFYDSTENQAHLYLYLEDGTVVELRLFEGGYVGYQNLGWYFVKMSGSAFDAVFAACRE